MKINNLLQQIQWENLYTNNITCLKTHLRYGDHDTQQRTYYSRTHSARSYITVGNDIALSFHNSFLNNYMLRNVFIWHSTIPLFVSVCLKRTHCFLSLITTDSNAKMHFTEAIHSWLAMAPMREHSLHNNELLRLPEDKMPVQTIEIKRQ